MSRTLLALATFLLVSMPLASTAAQDALNPLDVVATREGAGWVAIRFVDESGMFNLTVEPVGEYRSMFVHFTVTGDGYSAIGGTSAFASDWAGLRVETGGERVVDFESGLESRHGGEPDVRYEYRCRVCEERPEVRVREALVVVIVGGELGEWRVRVDSPQGQVLGVTEGADAWYLRGEDFAADTRVRVVHGSSGLHIEKGASVTLEAQHALIGFFSRSLASVAQLEADAPEGAESCPCIFDGSGEGIYSSWNPPHPRLSGAPGEYTFRFDDVGRNGFSQVYLVAADVVMPPR